MDAVFFEFGVAADTGFFFKDFVVGLFNEIHDFVADFFGVDVVRESGSVDGIDLEVVSFLVVDFKGVDLDAVSGSKDVELIGLVFTFELGSDAAFKDGLQEGSLSETLLSDNHDGEADSLFSVTGFVLAELGNDSMHLQTYSDSSNHCEGECATLVLSVLGRLKIPLIRFLWRFRMQNDL